MHVEKYNRSAMGHMLAHYDRTHPGSKSNIDAARTHLNTNYAAEDQPMPQIDFCEIILSAFFVRMPRKRAFGQAFREKLARSLRGGVPQSPRQETKMPSEL